MRRLLLAMVSASALVGLLAMPAAAAHGGEPTVVLMQHLCNPDIQSEADFVAAEDAGAGGQPGGEGTLPGLVATVLACPAVVLSGDTPTDGIGATPTDFEYTVADSAAATYSLTADGMLMAAKLCESDIGLDVDGDGTKSPDTCLDVSMYSFTPVAEGAVTITQTQPVGDSRFGTIRFTPASTDDATVLSAAGGVIELDTTADSQVDSPPLPLDEYNDDVVVVHIYNFQNVAATAPSPSTGASPSMGSSATATAPTAPVTLPMAIVALFGVLVAGSALVLVRTRR